MIGLPAGMPIAPPRMRCTLKHLRDLIRSLEDLYSIRSYDTLVDPRMPAAERMLQFRSAATKARRRFQHIVAEDKALLLCLTTLDQLNRWIEFVEPSLDDPRPLQDDEIVAQRPLQPSDPEAILEGIAISRGWAAVIEHQIGLRPRILLLSSSEALERAKQVRDSIPESFEVVLWNTVEALPIGSIVLQSLITATYHFDFGIFLLTADDLRISRGSAANVPRDNVIFELGLFLGLSSVRRAFVIQPYQSNVEASSLRLPSDLEGVVTARYSIQEGSSPTIEDACRATVASMEKILECKVRATV